MDIGVLVETSSLNAVLDVLARKNHVKAHVPRDCVGGLQPRTRCRATYGALAPT